MIFNFYAQRDFFPVLCEVNFGGFRCNSDPLFTGIVILQLKEHSASAFDQCGEFDRISCLYGDQGAAPDAGTVFCCDIADMQGTGINFFHDRQRFVTPPGIEIPAAVKLKSFCRQKSGNTGQKRTKLFHLYKIRSVDLVKIKNFSVDNINFLSVFVKMFSNHSLKRHVLTVTLISGI